MKIQEIQSGTKVHMIGIGGVSMSPLAKVLQHRGVQVTGSDGQESPALADLRALGIPVAVGHAAAQVGEADCIIRTAAVHEDNPEIQEARRRNLPVFERAEGWGAIMQGFDQALCIAGTHGKTTTTAMCGEIFLQAQRDPTLMLGGVLPSLGSGHCLGQGDTIIVESCEYCNSFHYFFPTVAVILNVEEDHLDFFQDLQEIQQSFRTFAQKVPDTGLVLVCGDEAQAVEALAGTAYETFGLESGDYHCHNLRWQGGYPSFTLMAKGQALGELHLKVPGVHNLRNALGAAAACLYLGVDFGHIAQGLAQFTGAGRRFQHKGEIQGAQVVDDYAHHPTEIQALLAGARQLDYQRIICLFQPHTYTRTQAFFQEFAQVLSLADVVLLLDIYAAREPDTGVVSSQKLAETIPGGTYIPSFSQAVARLKELAQPGDLILTVGAGDVFQVGEQLLDLK